VKWQDLQCSQRTEQQRIHEQRNCVDQNNTRKFDQREVRERKPDSHPGQHRRARELRCQTGFQVVQVRPTHNNKRTKRVHKTNKTISEAVNKPPQGYGPPISHTTNAIAAHTLVYAQNRTKSHVAEFQVTTLLERCTRVCVAWSSG
jgi:hypothetical protein